MPNINSKRWRIKILKEERLGSHFMCRWLLPVSKKAIGSYKCSSSGTELINIRFRTSIFVSFSASKRLYFFRFVTFLFFLRSRKFKNKVVQTISYRFVKVLSVEYRPGRDALQNINRKKQLDFALIRYWLVSTQAFLSLLSFTLALRFSGRDLGFFFQQQPWKNPIWTPILQHSFFSFVV